MFGMSFDRITKLQRFIRVVITCCPNKSNALDSRKGELEKFKKMSLLSPEPVVSCPQHSCSPNLFVQNVFVDTHDLRFPWVAFFTSK